MLISVLICTRDRAASLRVTLLSLFSARNLSSPDWEIVVVDNNSKDDTGAVCREFQGKYPDRFRSLGEQKPGKSNALNAGLAAVRGDVLAMTDDDVLFGPDFLVGIRATFSQPGVDGAQGRVLLECEGGRPRWLDEYAAAFLSERDAGESVKEWSDTLSGCNMVVRTKLARDIGGYAPELGPGAAGFKEDYDFSIRLRKAGVRLVYVPEILVWHRIPPARLKQSYFEERFFAQGRSEAYFNPLPSSFWRFGLYVAKEFVTNHVRAAWLSSRGEGAKSLRLKCDAHQLAGFCWQYWLFRRKGQQRRFEMMKPGAATNPLPLADDAKPEHSVKH